MRKFLKEYKVEIIFLFVVVIGLIGVFGRETVLPVLLGAIPGVQKGISEQITAVLAFFRRTDPFDLFQYFLVFSGLVFVIWRVRWHFMQSEIYSGKTCPECGAAFQRIHRTRLDHFFGKILFLPLNRYQCSNAECDWTGLRKPGHRRRRKSA